MKEHTDITKELVKIGEFRNILAHATIDVSAAALKMHPKEGVGFVSFKDGERVVKILTEIDFDEWNGRMGNVSSDIENLKRIIGVPTDW